MSISVMDLVLVIMASVGGLALHFFELSFRRLIADQQSTLVKRIAEQIDSQLKEASKLIASTASSFPLDLLNNADRAQAYLDTQLGLGTTSLFDNGIFLFTAEGLMLAEHPFKPGRRGHDYSFRKYFQDTVLSGQPQISDPYVSSQSHKHPAVNFTAPIRNGKGQILAVIAGSVDLTQKNFLGGLSEVHTGQTGYLYLFNLDRLLIMHADPLRIMKSDVPVGANIWFDRAIEGFEGTEETVNSRGLHTLVTFKRLNDDRWILAANYPTKEAFLPIEKVRHFFFVGIAMILLFSIAITWAVTSALLAPLIRLTNHVAGYSHRKGEKSVKGRSRYDEIGTLALTFDGLMAEVAEQRGAADNRLAFLQGIMDTIPHPTFYKDLEGRMLGGNTAMQTLCGKPLDKIVGTTIDDHLSAEAAQRLVKDDSLLIRGDMKLIKREINITLNNGEMLCALAYKALLKDSHGNPQGVVSSLVDINELKAVEMALAGEREFTLNLLQNSATPCVVLTANHEVLIWTRALEELTGLMAADVVGTNQHWRAFYPAERPCLADAVLDEDFAAVTELYPLWAKSPLVKNGIQAEGWRSLYNGESKYLTFAAAPIRDRNGKLVAVIETLHDLTNLKQTEVALRETQKSYHALVDSSPDAILVHRHGTILYGNRAATKFFCGKENDALTGRALSELIHPDCRENAFMKIAEVENKQIEQLYDEEKIICFDGQILNVEVGWSATHYAGEAAVQSVLRDITVRKAEQERIWQQANFDTLTGLPNRSLFMDRLEQALGRCDREGYLAALLFIDLDHFKEINDTLGHDNGDELLRQAAKRMNDCLRQTDTVCRLGGDEFTIILPILTDSKDVLPTTERLLKSLAKPFALPGGIGRISCSIGGAIYPRDGKNSADLMRIADVSMYHVKQNGRNGYYFPKLK
jgi:two-component system NtrC family sensor kinase